MATVIIQSEYDLPDRGSFLRFKTSKDLEWVHGMFSEWEPLRFIEGQDEYDPKAKTYRVDEVYEYQLLIFGRGYLD
jgi:hypothetical protein